VADRDFFEKVSEEINPRNDWRTTTYKRKDGSLFHVSIPPMCEVDNGEASRVGIYNEYSEMKMALDRYLGGGR
jgi:hypothetical protein